MKFTHLSPARSQTWIFAITLCMISIQGFGDTLVSTVDSYIRSYKTGTSYEGEHRTLVGYHDNENLGLLRGVVQFDLSAYSGMTINDVSLSLTAVAGQDGDQHGTTYADILLKDTGTTFGYTWNSFTPNGGDTSGATLSTLTGYDVYDGGDLVGGDIFTFASSSDFISAAQNAIDVNSGILSLVIYAPVYEEQGVKDSTITRNFYRFAEHSTLNISVIPEPSTLLMLGLSLGTLCLFRHKRV
ncbi:PEP-CTERM sorting domain-containing protein [Kiritimatiellota bacterium B12222]|nr:PEP-CTERM sorting domain-containing protein [Kiritimatiellota bacterium B12222]